VTKTDVIHNTCTYAAFHKAVKDILQRRLTILMSFCYKFISVYAQQ